MDYYEVRMWAAYDKRKAEMEKQARADAELANRANRNRHR